MNRNQLIALAVALLSCAAVARAQDAQPTSGGSGSGPTPQQCTAVMLAKCRYANLNACGATEWPAPQSDNNCCPNAPSCRLPQACNETVVRACDIDDMPVCPLDQSGAPTVPARTSDASCCPTCRRAPPRADRCTTDPSQLPRCAPGVVPSLVAATGCLSCRPEDGRVGNCTLSSLQQCAQTFASLPSCDHDDVQRNNQENSNPLAPAPARPCCLNCRPNYLQYCNATTIDACHRNHASLPVCGNGVRASFNKPSCCRACRRADPDADHRRPDGGICTFDKLRTCFQNAPICADGERPFVANTTFCCPECRRPERACSIEDVVRCRVQQPDCATGELPSHVDGECCATCKPVKAACSCDTNTQVCVYGRDVTVTPTCAPKLTVTFTLAAAASNSDALSAASALEIAHLLREMVARFCDHNANDGRCQRRATQIRNSDASYVVNADGSWTITITYPDVADDSAQDGGATTPTQAVAGQVLTVSTSADAGIYFDAASNTESGSGYTASDSSDASPRAVATGLSVVLAAAAAYAMSF